MSIDKKDGGLVKRQTFEITKKELAPLPDNPLEGQGYSLEDNEKAVIRDYFTKMRYGPIISDALICKGQACEFYVKCPLGQIGKLPPPNSPCPVELALAQQWCEDLANELEVDSASIIDNAQIQSIVSNNIFIKRAKEILAQSSPVIKVFKAIALDGTPLFEPRLHPLIYALREIHTMNDRDLNSLIATREAKSKADQRSVDAVTRMAEIATKIEGMSKGDTMGIKSVISEKLKEIKD